MSATLAIELNGVSKRFGGVHAVEDVSVSVPPGQIRGIIGPNGAGKTTLLNLLSGLQRPSAGEIRFFDQEVTGWKPHRIARRAGVIRTFQTVRLFETMTVFENVLVAADVRSPVPEERIFGHRSREEGSASERSEAVLQALGIAHLRDSRVP
jgi:branched-chain amino acid transport system ATP-binding protein